MNHNKKKQERLVSLMFHFKSSIPTIALFAFLIQLMIHRHKLIISAELHFDNPHLQQIQQQ